MEIITIADARTMMLVSSFLAGSVFFPGASESLSLNVMQTWKRIRAWLRELAREPRASRKDSFWQIDMTKFEP